VNFRPELLLGDAVDAGRRALRDLDPDQVPASLRRVAGYSGGTLPPPFARSLIVELDTNEYLRSKALEAWEGEIPSPGSRLLASYRFLERGEGWLLDLAEASFGLGDRGAVAGERTLQIERDAFEAEAASLRGRLKALRKEHERLEGELREVSHAYQEPVREVREAERRLAERLEEAKSDHLAEVEGLDARLTRAQDEIRTVREAAHLDRMHRAEAEAAYRAAVASETPSMDGDALAEHLDVIAALATASGPGIEFGEEAAGTPGFGPLRFPGMILPDSAEGVEWLVNAGAATVLIDGYNLGFLLAGRLDPPRARLLVLEVAGRLASAAEHAEVVAVFDSEIEGELEGHQSGGSVDIVYSSGRSADDEIVDRVGSAPNPVVITNDREVRHRSEAIGAVTLWSDALVEWSRRR